MAGTAVRQHDVGSAIECALDEVPLASHSVAGPVDGAGPHDRGRDAAVFQQNAFELRLLRRVGVVAGRNGRLRLRNRDRELGKVVDALSLVERAALLVGVDGRRGDCNERAGLELEQLFGVRRLERNDVDDEVEAVGDGECAFLVSVECNLFEARGRRPLGFARNGGLPAVSGERVRDRRADVAGATEDEGAAGDGCLDRDHRIADADLAVAENVGVEAAAMRERLDHTRLCHRLEMRAGLTELDAFAFDIADAEALADELVDVDTAREHVAPRRGRVDRHVALERDRVHRLGRDQGHASSRGRVAFRPEVTVALETASCVCTDALDRSRELAGLGRDEDRFDVAAHGLDPTHRARRRPGSRT
jgi:hypothetical protein